MTPRNTVDPVRNARGKLKKNKISKVPFVQSPRIHIPFQRIAMNVVGHLPRTKRENHYVMVIHDYATKNTVP
jgi:hypothetical protein